MKLIAWYDNEYGFTCNMMRLLAYIAEVNRFPQICKTLRIGRSGAFCM